jgi:hypothetical protein
MDSATEPYPTIPGKTLPYGGKPYHKNTVFSRKEYTLPPIYFGYGWWLKCDTEVNTPHPERIYYSQCFSIHTSIRFSEFDFGSIRIIVQRYSFGSGTFQRG